MPDPEIILVCGCMWLWGLGILGTLWLSNPMDDKEDGEDL
jgi:hypothetical protein